jgi:PAS domain S-box-containing protein
MPMSHSESIRKVLDGMRPRVQSLRTSAESGKPPRPVLEDALSELRTAMEELQVSEEELRIQAEGMAELQIEMAAELTRYQDLFRLSPEPRLVTDVNGMVRDANDAARRLLRPGAAGLDGKPLALYVAEEDRRAFRTALARLAHGEVVEAALRMSPRDALPVDVEVSVTARSSSPGAEPELHWTLRDVTARRAQTASHDEAAELHRMVVHSAPMPLVAMDLDGSVLLWNAAAQRLLGWSEEDVVGRRNPALTAEELARSRDAVEHGESEPRLVLAHRSGSAPAPVWLHDTPLLDADGTVRGFVTAFREHREADSDRALSPGAPAEELRRRWTREESLQVLRFAAPAGDHGDVVSRLRNWIASGLHLGYLRPDDRLPSIREVSQECAVDHRAVSAAYRTLAGDGVVEVRSRHGVYVAGGGPRPESALSETADWLAGVLGQAGGLQLKVPLIPDLVRDWTASTRVACACVDDTEDGLVALTTELRQQWGLETYPVPLATGPGGRVDEAALVAELRKADLVVTTSFHAGRVGAIAASLEKPVVVMRAHPELVDTLEERLAAGSLTAIVADAAYGDRLRCIRGGAAEGRLRVVTVSESAALGALDPAEPVLVTRAAQQRLGTVRARLLYPPSPVFCPSSGREIAEVLIATNIRAGRRLR